MRLFKLNFIYFDLYNQLIFVSQHGVKLRLLVSTIIKTHTIFIKCKNIKKKY